MNNQSDKPEDLEPKDSRKKGIKHPQDDKETVLKKQDKSYKKEEAGFQNPAEKREKSEQPVHSADKTPKS